MFGYLDMYRGDRRPVYDDWRDNVLKNARRSEGAKAFKKKKKRRKVSERSRKINRRREK
ncbi:MAG: hypothetical protein OSJ54_06300 [Oscillospiraceae bacterium]|nr:hypothetical protein [Oscillospiraceae bacterium]